MAQFYLEHEVSDVKVWFDCTTIKIMESFAMMVFALSMINIHLAYAQKDKQLGLRRSSNGTTALFRKIVANRKLNTTPITGYSNCSFRDCGKYCVYNIPCESFNFKTSTKQCELLSVDRNSKADNITFINANGWAYYDTGFNIRHPNWRHKSLHNISCTVNKCDQCPCIQPPEEGVHQCDCYVKEGLIKLQAGNWCWYVTGSCSASDGGAVIIRPCDQNDDGQQFMFNALTGDVFHKCSKKKVCIIERTVRVTENCARPWYLTGRLGLSTISECPAPNGLSLTLDNGLSLGYSLCLNEKGIHQFQKGVDGKIQVKMFLNINSFAELTTDPRFPNSPSWIGWIHQFLLARYELGAEYFGRQIKTVFVPPKTGFYIFYITVDEAGKLYITHPNSSPKLLISITSRSPSIKKTPPQELIAFEKYGIEVIMWEGLYNDYITVGVEFPDGKIEHPLTEMHLLAPN